MGEMAPVRSLLLLSERNSGPADTAVLATADALLVDLDTGFGDLAARLDGQSGRRVFLRTATATAAENLAKLPPDRSVEGIVLRGARDPEDVRKIDRHLSGKTTLVVEIDNARAVFFAHEFATAAPNVAALCFNGVHRGELAADLGCGWSIDGPELLFARQYVLVAARAAGAACPLDGPFADIGDANGFVRDTEISRTLGYRGRIVLDRHQAEAANRIYSPTPDEIAYHRRVLERLDTASAEGRASVTLDGKMIDIAHAETARAVIAQAHELGIVS